MIDHQPGSTGTRWRILALVVLASFFGYLLRSNMSIAGESMIAELGLTKVQLGAILAAFAWGYTIFQFPGGVWGDRIGGNIVGGIGALAVPLMVESLGWPVALAATAAFALVGAGLWFLIDAEATESPGA